MKIARAKHVIVKQQTYGNESRTSEELQWPFFEIADVLLSKRLRKTVQEQSVNLSSFKEFHLAKKLGQT